jgi:hypothetical protein
MAKVRIVLEPRFSIDGNDFAACVEFFEHLIGIQSGTLSWAGRIQTEELPRTIKRWEAWYRRYAGELRVAPNGYGLIRKNE